MNATVSRVSHDASGRLSRLTRGQQQSAMLAVALGAGYALLRQRLLPRWVMRGWFLLSAAALILPASALLYVVDGLRHLGMPRRWVQNFGVVLLSCAFKAVWWLNPQIRMRVTFDANERGAPAKWDDVAIERVAFALNHTSFWDVFAMIGVTPVSHLLKIRTLMKASLRNIPIFGGVFDRVGHFPVYFASDAEGNFSVDKERQAAVQVHVKAHLQHGGSIAIFPEGAINKTPDTLKTFRFGTFATIVDNRLPLYYMVTVGSETTWPPHLPFGGLPADIRIRIGAHPVDYSGPTDGKVLAVELHGRMQQVRDEIVAAAASEGAKRQDDASSQAARRTVAPLRVAREASTA